jgi:ABC-type molybdenum transport system ATPase subunit/photorepair protein PhrA
MALFFITGIAGSGKSTLAKALKAKGCEAYDTDDDSFARRAKNKDIFLCGVASNEDELRNLFKQIFELVIDNETLKHRLLTRTSNDWGKHPHELQRTLNAEELYRKHKPTLVDATQPIELVAANIIKKTRL